MALISEQLPNLMNGVSQQAVSMRMRSQCAEQLNAVSSVVYGNTKRPPTRYLTKVSPAKMRDAYAHLINRDVTERYIVVMEDGDLRVFDTEGTEKTVAFPDGKSYLAAVDPKTQLRAMTVADSTFIVNNSVTVEKGTATAPAQADWGQVFVRSLTYGMQAKVYIDGAWRAEAVTRASTDASGTNYELSLQRFAELLGSYLKNDPFDTTRNPIEWKFWPIHKLNERMDGGAAADEVAMTALPQAGWDVNVTQGLIHVERVNGAGFDMRVEDSDGNQHVKYITTQMPSFTDLPKVGKDGVVTKIVADTQDSGEGYYLKFKTLSDQTFGEGYWEETVAPGVRLGFDASTMPHLLVRESDGTFTFREAEWGVREAGDEESAPWPSFVGRKINEVYFDRRRLCFLADDNVIMSQAGAFFSFFPKTVSNLLDDDPIDVAASAQKVSILKSAVQFNGQTLFFSDQTQFALDTEFLLASKPPSVSPVANYESQGGARPASTGRTILFSGDQGAWSYVMEMYVAGDTETLLEAQDITEHVPSYIPRGVHRLAVSDTADFALAIPGGYQNKAYAYKYHWKGREKLQSSWSEWAFEPEAEVYFADFIKDECYLLIGYPDGTYIERMSVGDTQAQSQEPFDFRLDRRLDNDTLQVGGYDAGADTTVYILPYELHTASVALASRVGNGTSDRPPGVAATIVSAANDGSGNAIVTVRGNWANTQVYAGINYNHLYVFSEQVLKTRSGGGQAMVAAGRLQLLRWHVFYDDTGFFKATVKSNKRDEGYTYRFTGTLLGALNNTIGGTSLDSGTFSFRVGTEAKNARIELSNDSFLPSVFTGAEWEARFTRRTSRI